MRIFSLLCTALMVSLLAACDSTVELEQPPPRPVKAMVVPASTDYLSVSFPGVAEPVNEVNLAFEVAGRLEQLPVQVGQTVKAGDVIAKVHNEAFQLRFDASQAEFKQASSELQRLRRLLKANSISQTRFDEAQTRFDLASSQLALNKKLLADTTLTAPFDGKVVAVYVDNFSYLQASTPVARIVDSSQLEMWIDLPETLAKLQSLLLTGNVSDEEITSLMTAHMEFDAYPGLQLPARLKELGQEASQRTRTYPLSLMIDQPEGVLILPGMSGQAHLKAKLSRLGLSSYLLLPATALFNHGDDNSSYVWVVEDSQVQRRQVSIGSNVDGKLQITAGLEPDEIVVTAGANSLTAGQQVKLPADFSQPQ